MSAAAERDEVLRLLEIAVAKARADERARCINDARAVAAELAASTRSPFRPALVADAIENRIVYRGSR